MSVKKPFLFLLHYSAYGLALAFLFLLVSSHPILSGFANNNDEQRFSFNDAVTLSAPAVVNVYASKVYQQRVHPLFQDPLFQRFFGELQTRPQQQRDNSIGSGVVMNDAGYILTNAHVINNTDNIRITLNDGRQASAKLIGIDSDTDLAVIKIELEGLPNIPIGDSSQLRVGDIVLAIGNPYNFGQTVTQGIVSATSRKRRGISIFDDFIQTDADINIGNSGGALINSHGELIGINTAIISSSGGSEGIGLATPVNQAINIMQQIIENGRVIRGWLGIEAQTLDPNVIKLANLNTGGVLVSAIMRNSPAELAGLIPGDIIITINGTNTANPDEAIETIMSIKPGTKVKLLVLRGWEQIELMTTILQRPSAVMPG